MHSRRWASCVFMHHSRFSHGMVFCMQISFRLCVLMGCRKKGVFIKRNSTMTRNICPLRVRIVYI